LANSQEIVMKYGEVTLGQMEAAINKLGGMDGFHALLRDELEIRPKSLPFPKNKNGHYIVNVTGLGLSGREEIGRLEEGGFRIGDYARQILLSANSDSYDANHRLEAGCEYTVVIVLGRELTENRTTAGLQLYAVQFGYTKPLAGIVPRLREAVSDRQMEQMDGIWYIAGLHDPIIGFPTAIRACSARFVTVAVGGLARIGTGLAASGMTVALSRSSSRKLALRTKFLGSLLNLGTLSFELCIFTEHGESAGLFIFS
jgi:hypothetical protein